VSLPYCILKHVFRCFLLIIAVFWANRADAVVTGIEANFVRNNTVLEDKEIASNVFGVKNHTGKSVRFRLKLSVPAGWNILSSSEKEFEIEAGDSIFIPVRVVPGNEIKGGTSYVITATMASDRGMQFSAQNWYVTLPVRTKWTANLPIKQQFFYNNNDSSGVELYLRNEGNADEELRVTILPDRRLELLRTSGGAGLLSFTISLPAGTLARHRSGDSECAAGDRSGHRGQGAGSRYRGRDGLHRVGRRDREVNASPSVSRSRAS